MRRLRTHFATTFCAALASLGAAAVPAAHAAIASQTITAQAAVPGAGGAGAAALAGSVDPDPSLSAGAGAPSAFAPLAAAAPSGAAPTVLPGLNQPGLGATYGEYPPDQGGAIGPDHYVQGVNTGGIAVYRRSDLAQVGGPILLEDFAAAPVGHVVVDTQVIWDQETSRWYYSFTYKHDGNPRTSGLLYGWSKTSDPTDLEHGWCQMRIDTGADFEDRPKLGDSAGYLILTTNVDPIGAGYYDHVWTIPKPAAGSTTCPASQSVKSFGSRTQPLKTSDGDIVDSAIPAADNAGSSTGYVMSADDRVATTSQLMLWHVNPSGDLVADGNVAVSPFTDPPLAAQPSPYTGLDTIDRRLNSAVAERDPDAGATAIWTQHTIADPAGTGRSIVRWYEILPGSCAPLSGTTCNSAVRRQQGELKDSANSLFNAALSPTGTGNEAVIHYNAAGSGQLAQVRARSRVSNTPLGSFGSETTIETSDAADKDFTCADSRPGCRWGDYSAVSADPNDPHVVWGSSQALGPQNGTQPNWKTRNFAIQATSAPSLVHSATGAADSAPGGDADGVVEPGESIDLGETVRNAGSGAASGISGTLSSNSAGLSITSASSAYPDMAAGATGTNNSPFRASVSSSIACGVPLATTLSLTTSQGSYRVPVSIKTGAAGPAQSTAATDVPKTIPDGNAAGVTSSVSLTGSGRVADLNVSIARITHTFDGDLRIELTGPDGTSVVLADRPGGVENPGDNLVNTVFDDEAGTSLAAGAAPYTGSFRPQGGRLSAFDGKPIQGTWTLRVSDMSAKDTGRLEGWGTRVAAATCDVSSNTPPAAGFTATPDPAPTGQAITFTSTSSDPDGTVASQAWDLDNDGQFDDGSGTSATKSFGTPGSYTVRLRAIDDRGASSIATRIVTVTNRPPVPSFTASPDPALTGQTVTFSSTSTDPDGSIAAYAWDLDGNGTWDAGVTGAGASRSFPRAGSYTVRLRVTDDLGQTAETTRTVTVDNRAPVAGYSVSPGAPSTGQSVTFTSTATDQDGTIAAYAWDTDNDGAWDPGMTDATATRAFANAGTYTVRLRVTDDNGATDTKSATVTVANRAPAAAFSVAPGAPLTAQAVTFTSSSTDPDGTVASQAWDTDNDGAFDDGTAATASRTFSKSGTYTVKLRVVDDDGGTDVATRTVTVANRPPVASVASAPAAPSTGDPVTFTASSSDPDGTVAAQAWDLDGDGQFDDGTGATASRSFAKSGTYAVQLRVTDDEGATATADRTVTVSNRAPTASFTISPNPTSAGEPVTFESTAADSDGTIASYAWDLDNNGQFDAGRTGPAASRSFAAPGVYTVRLRVTDDDGATATKSSTVTIDNRAPSARFSFTPDPPSTNDAMTFTSESTDPDGAPIAGQAWDLDGDGQYDDGTAATASHSFPKAGDHVVGLRVTDADGGTSAATHVVTVAGRRPSASFSVDAQSVKPGEPSHFDAAASGDSDGSVVRYEWDLDGNGTYETDTGASPETSRFYADPGNVIVGLRVTDDDGLTGTTERTVTVTEPSPFAEDPTPRPPDGEPLPGVGPNPSAPPDPGSPAGKPVAQKAPSGGLRVTGRRLDDALARGLALRYSSNQAVTVQLKATVSARVARRFGVATRAPSVVIGSATRLAGAGRASMRLKLFSGKRAHAAGAALPMTVKLTLIGSTGLSRSYTARVVLRPGR